jgi:cytochrome P450
VFLRYEDVNAALRDQRWSRWEAAKDEYGEAPPGDAEMAEGIDVQRRMMINRDDPDHKRIRRLVAKAFVPTAVASWKPRVDDVVDRLIESVQGVEEFDLLKVLGFPLPEIVICELMGVPPEDHDLWKEWIDIMVNANRMHAITGEELDTARAATIELAAYFGRLCEDRRHHPRADLVTTMVEAESEGERLDRIELIGSVIMLVAGGHETTANLVGNGMYCLLKNPDQYARLREDPSLLPTALEEMLRCEGPGRHPLARRALEDITIRDITIPAGSIGLTLGNSANRDPEVFDDPETFDIGRSPNQHIAFGAGAHFCIGHALARMEAGAMFDAIIRRLPRLELAEEPKWAPVFLRALQGLKVAPAS